MEVIFSKINETYFHFPCLGFLTSLYVSFQDWPEEEYPPYANGPGYVLSSDIAHFIVSEFESLKLRVYI